MGPAERIVGRGRFRGSWVLALTVAGVFVLAGCSGVGKSLSIAGEHTATTTFRGTSSANSGQTSTTNSGQAPVGGGFLYTDEVSEATFVQWTITHGAISGTMQDDNVTGTAPSEQLSTTTYAVTGILTGSQVILRLEGASQVYGTFTHDVLKLNFLNQDGTLTAATFNPASPTDFNNVVQMLHSKVNSDNQAAIRQQQIQQRQQQIQQQTDQQEVVIDQAATTAWTDVMGLNSTNFTSNLTSLQADANHVQNDLGQIKKDYVQVENDQAQNNGAACGDLTGLLGGDLTGLLGGDLTGLVESDAQQLQTDINNTRSLEQTAKPDVAAYQTAQAKLPNYQPHNSNAFSSGGPIQVGNLNSAESHAKSAVANAISQGNVIIAQANSYEAQGIQIEQQAAAALSNLDCGTPGSPPSPVAALS